MQLQPGAVVAERFRLIRQLGRGGMGEVWAAQHIRLDVPCAVKFIHAESAARPETRARFEREAKAAAQLRSPNVVQILDYGIFGEMPYIAMEYLEGEDLSVRLRRHSRLEPAVTYQVVLGIAKALQKAHQAGIVHRDLKPENVYLVPDLGGEVAKVLDFGVAKQSDTLDSNTQTGALLGTPYYMSPEQAQGTKTVDHRSDLWSLGVLTYRCLTGELPFKSQALGDLLIKIVTHPIPVPSHVAPTLPPGFDVWYARASQRDPSQRFGSAWEMAEQLGVALGLRAGAPLAAPAGGASTFDRTVLTDETASGALPFVQSGASQAEVSPMARAPVPSAPSHDAAPTAAFGATQIATTPYAHHAQGPAPGPMMGGSVGGVTSTAKPQRQSGRRLAVVLGALAVLGVGGGALVAMRAGPSEDPAPAGALGDEAAEEAEEAPAQPRPPDRPGPATTPKAADEGTEPPPEAEEGGGGGAPEGEKTDSEPATPQPVVPMPRPQSLPPPRPRPKTPSQPKGYDPGF